MVSVAFAVGCLVVAVGLCRLVPSLREWPPAFGLLVATFTVVPPHETVAVGIGADDALFLIGVAWLLGTAIRSGARSGGGVLERVVGLPYARWLAVGATLLVAGTTVSAFVNGEGLGGTLSMVVRGPGRVLLYVVAVVIVYAGHPRARTRALVCRALAGVGTFESLVGVVAYAVGLPGGFGLEPARGNTSLLGEIPGRVTGTLELSSNFLGALLTLAIPVTIGLVLDARGRLRWFWAAAALVQVVALVLTFTRSSLGVTLLACAIVVALRARLRWLIAGAVAVAILLVATPAGDRILHDNTDRAALYISAVRVFADHPIAGVGPGEQATFTAAEPERYRATPRGVAGNNAHNTVLLAGAEDGVLGMAGALELNVVFAAIAVGLIRRTRRRRDRLAEPLGIAVGMVAFLLQGMVNNLFTVTLTATALVMLVAGCALPWLAEPEPAAAEANGESNPDDPNRPAEPTEPRDTPIRSSSQI